MSALTLRDRIDAFFEVHEAPSSGLFCMRCGAYAADWLLEPGTCEPQEGESF
jgi:hypothetical protein